jgi:hypothetical protein
MMESVTPSHEEGLPKQGIPEAKKLSEERVGKASAAIGESRDSAAVAHEIQEKLSPTSGIQATPPPNLVKSLKTARAAERSAVMQSVISARNQMPLVAAQIRSVADRKDNPNLTMKDLRIKAAARQMMRQAKLEGRTLNEQNAIAQVTKALQDPPGMHEELKDIEERFTERNAEKIGTSYIELCTILKTLDDELYAAGRAGDKAKVAEVNEKILILTRKAVQTEAYKALCTDESLPAIRYLHRIVMASFANQQPLDAYREIGEETLKQAEKGASVSKLEQSTFPKVLQWLREAAITCHLTASDKTCEYILENKRIAFSALQGEVPGWRIAWGEKIGLLRPFRALLSRARDALLGRYDPRMAENSSGTLFKERVGLQGSSKEVVFMYTPSPTLGDEVSPEAEAFLQALENRQFMSKEELDKEPSYAQATHWSFASLQNIDAPNEGFRAKSIMELNRRFPLSFTGITVSQDSGFYRDLDRHIRGDKKVEQSMINHGRDGFTESYRDQMKTEVFGGGGGYRFPEPMDQDFESKGKQIIDYAFEVVSLSSELTRPKQGTNETKKGYNDKLCLWQWRQRAAFRELANLGIMRYWQLRSLGSQGTDVATCCCKECIDRGGKMMGEMMWALGDGSPETLKQVFTAVQGRALLSRNRIILPERLTPFLALTEMVPQDVAHGFLANDIAAIMDRDPPAVQSQAAVPAVGK